MKGELAIANGCLLESADDHAGVAVGYRIHLVEEEEAMLAIDEPRTMAACLAIIAKWCRQEIPESVARAGLAAG